MAFSFAGIDFGSNMAGTTVMTCVIDEKITFFQSIKNKTTDTWLLNLVSSLQIEHIFIDAPLSLPSVYQGLGHDYFYRQADRELKAMSPMFLGGLTARAMQLSNHLNILGVKSTEVYPAAFVKHNKILNEIYIKKDAKSIIHVSHFLCKSLPYPMYAQPDNYHQIDSIICWWIGYNYTYNLAKRFGNESEGYIWI